MTDYPFDNILAVDASGPELLGGLPVIRVASNALVTLFDVADPTKTPVALTTVDGLPIPNPVQVNAIGMGPAPVAQFWQLGWEGGGLSGVFTSNLGLRNETLAAVEAAQGAQLAAENAASTAGADAAAAADAALAGAVSDAESAQAAAEAAAALVGAPADSAIAAAVSGPTTETRTALNATYAGAEELVIIAGRHASPQAAIDAAPAGATVRFTQPVSLTTALTVNKPLTIDSSGAGSVTQTGTGQAAFNVTSSDVKIRNLPIIGRQSAALIAGERAINIAGASAAAPIDRILIEGCEITGWGQYGVLAQYARGVRTRKNNIRDIAYSGITYLSVLGGDVADNEIKNIVQGTGATNSYGIAMTRGTSASLVTDPHTSDVTVKGNKVDGVTGWEGIDTHAGQRISIIGNQVLNCRVGIAVVPCPATSGGPDVFGARDIVVQGNTIDGGVTDGSRGPGISFVGAGDGTAGGLTEAATGTITGNTIRNHGTETSSTSGGIVAYYTRGLSISANRISECSPNGIVLYHTNYGYAVSGGNVIVDPWSNASNTVGVMLNSTYNEGLIAENTISRGIRAATKVLDNGIRINSSSSTVKTSLGLNRITGTAAAALVDTSGTAAADFLGPLNVNGAPTSRGADVQIFTSSGTWTKPTGAVSVSVICIAGGGGGGSGRRGAAGTVRCGGGGGAGGAVTRAIFPGSSVTNASVTVGTGGAGGAAVTTDDTNGNAGVIGGASTFAAYAKCGGGSQGSGGTNATGTGGAAIVSGMFPSSAGGSASTTGGAGNVALGIGAAASGGGSGGGITSADATSAGGSAGAVFSSASVATGTGGAAGGGSGVTGTASATNAGNPGQGGGGGGSSTTSAGGNGADGAIYGGGGGGGGASLNGFASGAGGKGGDGIVIVTTTF